MPKLRRRDALKAGAAVAPALMGAASPQVANAQADNNQLSEQTGQILWPKELSNPLEARIVVFTTVSHDVEASISFYRDVIGMTLVDDRTLPGKLTSAPGIGKAGRRQILLQMPESSRSASVRILEAPSGAQPIRPRPDSGPNDPGLLVMEGSTRDPAESYHALATAGTKMISPPRYYWFRNTTWGRNVDVMSYAPFGPGGEQMFITAQINNDRPEPSYPGLHSGFANAAIVSLNQEPVTDFYEKALGLKRTSQMECYQRNCNELIGAPANSYFLWGNVGSGVSIEVWEVKASKGTMYPTSLDRTGLAMLTIRVNDIEKCRRMCDEAGIRVVGEGALPSPDNIRPDGFTLRGAVGELIEVIGT